jgi:hypothetical protein
VLLLLVIVDWSNLEMVGTVAYDVWLAILFMVVVSSGCGYMLYNATVKEIRPTLTSCRSTLRADFCHGSFLFDVLRSDNLVGCVERDSDIFESIPYLLPKQAIAANIWSCSFLRKANLTAGLLPTFTECDA